MMKPNRFLPGAAVALVLGGAITALAAPKTYQYTGIVKAVSKTQIDVDKGGEVWEFAVDPDTSGDAKIGDKVTVTYRMHATRIDKK